MKWSSLCGYPHQVLESPEPVSTQIRKPSEPELSDGGLQPTLLTLRRSARMKSPEEQAHKRRPQ